MSRDWIPAGSQPYDTAFVDGPYTTQSTEDDGTQAYFSTIPYRAPKVRDPKQCSGNDGTCKGFKSGGTDLCYGHRKSLAAAAS